MLALLSAVLVVAAPPPVKLAAPGLSYVNVPEKKGRFFSDYFAQQLSLQGLSVTTASEIGALLGFERQRQLMGCSEEEASNCVAELAGALGADGLITGSIAKFKAGYTVSLKILAADNGRSVALAADTVRDEDALLEWLRDTAKKFAPLANEELGHTAPPPTMAVSPVDVEAPAQPRAGFRRTAGLLSLGIGAAGAAVGTYSFVMHSQVQGYQRAASSDVKPLYDADLSRLQVQGIAGAAGAAVLLAAGAFLLFGGDSDQPSAALVPVPGGTFAVFTAAAF